VAPNAPGTTQLEARIVLPPSTAGQHAVKLGRSLYSGRVARLLREAIIDGALVEGTPLVETQLAGQLSVSRGPVRSALQVLQGEGLVETRSNGRMVTVRFGPEDVDDLLRVRLELESSAVRRGAAARRDIEPVRAALDAFKGEGASTERLVELDIDFHRSLVALGGSRFLLGAWLALAPVIQAVITIGNRRLARQDPSSHYLRIVAAHEPILGPLSRFESDAVVEMLAEQFALTRAQFARNGMPG
jgi:GntR family transcriptional regulator of gluconate operon